MRRCLPELWRKRQWRKSASYGVRDTPQGRASYGVTSCVTSAPSCGATLRRNFAFCGKTLRRKHGILLTNAYTVKIDVTYEIAPCFTLNVVPQEPFCVFPSGTTNLSVQQDV